MTTCCADSASSFRCPTPTGSWLTERSRRGWLFNAAAVAAVILAVETARAYIDARNYHGADRARELVADHSRTSEVPDTYSLDTMEPAFEVHEAYRFKYTEGD